jgi:hypothetical protein
MINQEFARHFADDWIESWNSHDLDRIMAHYSDEVTFSGPFVSRIASESSGTLNGKKQVRTYWEKALNLVPDLRFELVTTLVGVGSVVLVYKNAKGQLNAEMFYFRPDGLIYESAAHGVIQQVFKPPREAGHAEKIIEAGLQFAEWM